MLNEERTNLAVRWALRLLLGGICGLVGQAMLATAASRAFGGHHAELSLGILGSNPAVPVELEDPLVWGTCFLLGMEAGAATLPFAEEGRKLLLQSLGHFALTLLTAATLGWVLLSWQGVVEFLVFTALLYVLVWLGRWASWWAEAEQLRRVLGLHKAPSKWKWRETLPHIAFAFLLCAVLPLSVRFLDAPDVPVLSVFLVLPALLVGAFFPGVSLGRRQGFCPLYPLACGLFSLAALPVASIPWYYYPAVALPSALLGNLLGWCAGTFQRWLRTEAEDTGPHVV